MCMFLFVMALTFGPNITDEAQNTQDNNTTSVLETKPQSATVIVGPLTIVGVGWPLVENWCDGDGSFANPFRIADITIDAQGAATGLNITSTNMGQYFEIVNVTIQNATAQDIYIDSAYNGLFHNLTIHNSSIGMQARNSQNIEISNSTFIGLSSTALYLNGQDSWFHIHHNEFLNPLPTVGYMINAQNIINYCQVEQNHIDGAGFATGVYFHSSAQFNNITANHIENCVNGIELTIGTTTINNISLNIVEHSSNMGIRVEGANANLVFNNTIRHGSGEGIYLSNNQENKIEGNYIYNLTNYAIYLSNSIGTDILGNNIQDIDYYLYSALRLMYGSNDTLIQDNYFANINDTALYAYNCGNISVINNQFYDAMATPTDVSYGVWISGSSKLSSVIVANNTIVNYETAIYLGTSSHSSVLNNEITRSVSPLNDIGIYLSNVDNTSVSNNLISYSDSFGFYIYNSPNNTFSSNIVDGAGQSGMYITSSDNTTLFNNTLINGGPYGSNPAGLYLSGSDSPILMNNTISDNYNYGIYLSTSDYGYFQYNNISGNGAYGVRYYLCDYGVWYNNTVNENHQYAFYVYLSNYNTITGNVIMNNWNSAFSQYSSSGNILDPNYYYIATASFSVNATTIIAGQSIEFVDTSTGDSPISYYYYQFGDGFTSDQPNPVHTFWVVGTYHVNLTIHDANWDWDIYDIVITVQDDYTPQPEMNANFTDLSLIDFVTDVNYNFTEVSTTGNPIVGWEWNFIAGGLNYSTSSVLISFDSEGFYNVQLTVQDIDGDLNSTSYMIYVNKNIVPNASFTTNASLILVGESVAFTQTSVFGNTPIVVFYWESVALPFSSSENHSVWTYRYTDVGVFDMTFTVIDAQGEVSNYTVNITVEIDTIPNAEFSVVDTNGNMVFEINESLTFSGSMISSPNLPYSYQWNFGDGTGNITDAEPSHIFATNGTYTITCTVVDRDGDSDVYSYNIIIEGPTTSDPDNTDDPPNPTDAFNDLMNQPWFLPTIGSLGGVMVLIAVFQMMLKGKRKKSILDKGGSSGGSGGSGDSLPHPSADDIEWEF